MKVIYRKKKNLVLYIILIMFMCLIQENHCFSEMRNNNVVDNVVTSNNMVYNIVKIGLNGIRSVICYNKVTKLATKVGLTYFGLKSFFNTLSDDEVVYETKTLSGKIKLGFRDIKAILYLCIFSAVGKSILFDIATMLSESKLVDYIGNAFEMLKIE